MIRLPAVLATLLFPLAALAQPAPTPAGPPVLRVSGVGEVEVAPDRAILTLAVDTQAAKADAAARENARLARQVMAALKKAGVAEDDLETLGYSVHPRYEPVKGGRPRVSGYQASNTVQVTVRDLARAGTLIDVALGAGANRVNQVRYEVSDEGKARGRALRQAVAQARADAQALAEALGVRLGAVQEAVTEAEPVHFPMMRAQALEAAADESTPLKPQAQTVRARVSLVYAIDARPPRRR